MSQDIQVSVICNVFNHERYLRDALDGFVKQKTDFPFEVLVHDDASTDGSAEIIREYEEKYPDIIKPIYQQENQFSKGVKISQTFNLPRAKGRFLAFCEGDDYWTDTLKLQKQYDFLNGHSDYSLCACSCVWLNMKTGKTENRCKIQQDTDLSLEEIISERKGRIFQFGTIMIRTDVYKNLPEWKNSFPAGDYAIAIHSAMSGKVHMLADAMTVYRNHAVGSWTSRMDNAAHREKTILRFIEGLTVFNEATDRRYDEIVTARILRFRYDLAKRKRDLKAMTSGDLRTIYASKSFPKRIADVLACKVPWLYKLLVKVIG